MHLSPIYRGVTTIEVGDGSSVLFWKDMWLQEIISESHPRLFSFATNEDVSVQKLLTAQTLGANFILPLSAQAREELTDLQSATTSTNLVAGLKDKWSCVWGRENFSSSKFYLYCFREMQADEAFGWIWKTRCNNKWKVFLWLFLADRINTRNMLRRRGMSLQNNNYGCLLCSGAPEETVEHLFFKCPFSTACWEKLGITWPDLHNRLQLVHSAKQAWARPMFMEVFAVAAWGLWKERNNKHFHGVLPTVTTWRMRFKSDFELLRYKAKRELEPFILSLVASV